MVVHIDVYHDLICPWCRIGKRNLDTALAAWTGEAPTVAYHPYVLNPDAPDEPMSIAEFFRTRKGIANPQPMLDRVVLAVNFDMLSRSDRNELYAAGAYHFPWLRPRLLMRCDPARALWLRRRGRRIRIWAEPTTTPSSA